MAVHSIKKNHNYQTGFIVSAKHPGEVRYFEGSYEWAFLILVDRDDDVLEYQDHIRIPYTTAKGNSATYTVDVRVVYHCGRTIYYEVKPLESGPKNHKTLSEALLTDRHKYRAGIRYAWDHGGVFKFLKPSQVPTVLLTNAKFLKPYFFRKLPQVRKDQIMATMLELSGSTPQALVDALAQNESDRLILFPSLWQLIAQKQVQADLYQPLTNNCRIWLDED